MAVKKKTTAKKRGSASKAEKAELTTEEFRKKINKEFKSNLIISAAEEDYVGFTERRVSSGSLSLDIALSGGFMRGRIHKLQGRKSAGKSKIVASTLAEFTTRHNERIAYIDIEGTSGKYWLYAHGNTLSNIDYGRPVSAEEALDLAEAAFMSGLYSAVVIDSFGAMVTEERLGKSHKDKTQADLARLITPFVNEIMSHQNRSVNKGVEPPTLFILNQIRNKLHDNFNPESTPGGEAQDNAATTILSLMQTGKISTGKDEAKQIHGFYTLADVVKNKTGAPFRRAKLGIVMDDGFEGHPNFSYYHGEELKNYGILLDVIQQSGAWYEIPGYGKFQGQGAVHSFLMENAEARQIVTDAVIGSLPNLEIEYSSNLLGRSSNDKANLLLRASQELQETGKVETPVDLSKTEEVTADTIEVK